MQVVDKNSCSSRSRNCGDKKGTKRTKREQPDLSDFSVQSSAHATKNRCLLPEVPCHITQRGVDRREVFSSDQDRTTYLSLVQENLSDAGVRILGYCLMSNHVHLIPVPAREESLSILFRRAWWSMRLIIHGRARRHIWKARIRPDCSIWDGDCRRLPATGAMSSKIRTRRQSTIYAAVLMREGRSRKKAS